MLNKRYLPSIAALQCFEAVTRHLSFTRAAEELNLTQSAVSKQVAQLEAPAVSPGSTTPANDASGRFVLGRGTKNPHPG